MGNQQSGSSPSGGATPTRDRKDPNQRSSSENPFKKLPVHLPVARAYSTDERGKLTNGIGSGPGAAFKAAAAKLAPASPKGSKFAKNSPLPPSTHASAQSSASSSLAPIPHRPPIFSQFSTQSQPSQASSAAPTPTLEKPAPALLSGGGGGGPAGGPRSNQASAQQSDPQQRRAVISSSMDVEKGSDPLNDNSSGSGSAGRRSSIENGAQVVKDVIEVVQHALTKSPHLPRIRRPSMDMSFLPGRRSRRSSGEQEGPIHLKVEPAGPPSIPSEEVYVPTHEKRSDDSDDVHPQARVRASTIGSGQVARSRHLAFLARRQKEQLKEIKRLIPTVFRYAGHQIPKSSDEKMFVSGTMTNWKTKTMSRPEGEQDFIIILDCPEGEVYFKFHLHDKWLHDPKQPTIKRESDGRIWNVITVERTDNDVFEALACDSFSLKDNRCTSGLESDLDRLQGDSWSQEKPSENILQLHKSKGPPILPPHLLQILLNKEFSDMGDPVLLPEPSHVSLHHLYAQSIRDKMLVLSTTTRYRKKCVTVVLYKPLEA
ncbi:hypothetical protein TCAL_03250 [Tigriopus californicus]|uniref:5'-AMP-activated protein kinase subunit beta-1 n=1 Tax=Tigriopus californicus TaxID=6832 RepID=A0A553NVL7_TIGCA|nr:uncharacterized protein LOC131877405 [Tigriopus californicus]XP_059079047.1 uncharacterized protein LOC131877405 [Tigriopus californicus]TRY69469.1 hypothetical protein TCAL_03250 [Tigriopus californicus]|eukprot:TCALIF_03250-PA protein Name:"Similar to PRKAB2 5'-AMP-activated protein kinase subunit beta-2 (Homo sapiens)" AED:0.00 eAED:0.00 QI:57/1/1/1/0.66/0.5/4/392/541